MKKYTRTLFFIIVACSRVDRKKLLSVHIFHEQKRQKSGGIIKRGGIVVIKKESVVVGLD